MTADQAAGQLAGFRQAAQRAGVDLQQDGRILEREHLDRRGHEHGAGTAMAIAAHMERAALSWRRHLGLR